MTFSNPPARIGMKAMATKREGRTVKPAATLTVPMHPHLKELIGKAADDAGLPMNEWLAKLLASHFRRPDLAEVPRRPFGRPRKHAVA